jgi:hypothetical protein
MLVPTGTEQIGSNVLSYTLYIYAEPSEGLAGLRGGELHLGHLPHVLLQAR